MKSWIGITAALFVIAVTAFGCASHPIGPEWTTLVDGPRGLENWNRLGDANWRVEGDTIVADKGKGGHLVTKNSYRNFEIYAEFWADHTTNSGIFIRASDANKIGATNAYEVNIFDQSANPQYATGSIVNFAAVPPNMYKAGGKWNTLEIYANGPEVTVKLNGAVTVSMRDSQFASGPFTLQYGNRPNDAPGGAIKWRKVMVRTL